MPALPEGHLPLQALDSARDRRRMLNCGPAAGRKFMRTRAASILAGAAIVTMVAVPAAEVATATAAAPVVAAAAAAQENPPIMFHG